MNGVPNRRLGAVVSLAIFTLLACERTTAPIQEIVRPSVEGSWKAQAEGPNHLQTWTMTVTDGPGPSLYGHGTYRQQFPLDDPPYDHTSQAVIDGERGPDARLYDAGHGAFPLPEGFDLWFRFSGPDGSWSMSFLGSLSGDTLYGYTMYAAHINPNLPPPPPPDTPRAVFLRID